MNHYATNMFFNQGGRHYWFAKYLLEHGYEPTIFCANTRHNREEAVALHGQKYIRKISGKIPFVFVKSGGYRGNRFDRIKNMLQFAWNLYALAKKLGTSYGRPDLILASSVHPLTLVAGLAIAKKFGVGCIGEIRDLWPEALVTYGFLKGDSLAARALYRGEKWLYKKMDKLIFTQEGGKDYIIEKGWDRDQGGPLDLNRVGHINNGIDLEAFDYNRSRYVLEDEDLEEPGSFKVIYTGSLGLVNKVEKVLDVAKILKDQGVKFLIWGTGDQLDHLRNRVKVEQLKNVSFKGWVEKKYVPSITTRGQLNIILGDNLPLYRFGTSNNKLFDYFASGKPILITKSYGYSLIERYRAGRELADNSAENIARNILYFKNLDEDEYSRYGQNARQAARDYDFKKLTKKLVDFIEA